MSLLLLLLLLWLHNFRTVTKPSVFWKHTAAFGGALAATLAVEQALSLYYYVRVYVERPKR